MERRRNKIKEWIIREVMRRRIRQKETGKRLGVTIRRVKKNCKRFLERGAEGLKR